MFKKNILVLVQGELQDSFTHSVWALHELGYQLFAMPQSANVLEKNKGPCPCVAYATDTKSDLPLCIDINKNDEIGLVINVPMHKSTKSQDNYVVCNTAVDFGVPLLTNMNLFECFMDTVYKLSKEQKLIGLEPADCLSII